MRKLSKGERNLLILLLVAALGAAYYYLFWNTMSGKITADQDDIDQRQTIYDDYKNKISALPDLQAQLEAIKNQPSNKEKFYTAEENQEIYMDFLQKLIDDNGLILDSVAFSRQRVELPVVAQPPAAQTPAAPTPTPAAAGQSVADVATGTTSAVTPTPVSQTAAASQSYLNVMNAAMSFYVDFDKPENLLNMLQEIENNDKMVLVDNLQLNIKQGTPAAAANTKNPVNTDQTAKMYQCTAIISFVNLVIPPDTAPSPTPAPGNTATPGGAATPGVSAALTPAASPQPDSVVEVPVETAD